jgi:Holliday junction resolvase RusA-like endonuclease
MTQKDKWAQRPCTRKYWAFKDEIRLRGITLPNKYFHVTFVIPMPKSWSNIKKRILDKTPHQRRPDADNLFKALSDAIYKEDSHLWDYRITKVWGYKGKIIIMY